MNELKPEVVMKALEHCANAESCIGCGWRGHSDGCIDALMRDALTLLREKDALIEALTKNNADLEKELAETHDLCEEKDAEIERLKHSKGVAQVNIINEIANRMQIKEFNSHEIATGYSWAINDLLKLLLELKKQVMRGNKDDQM